MLKFRIIIYLAAFRVRGTEIGMEVIAVFFFEIGRRKALIYACYDRDPQSRTWKRICCFRSDVSHH